MYVPVNRSTDDTTSSMTCNSGNISDKGLKGMYAIDGCTYDITYT